MPIQRILDRLRLNPRLLNILCLLLFINCTVAGAEDIISGAEAPRSIAGAVVPCAEVLRIVSGAEAPQ